MTTILFLMRKNPKKKTLKNSLLLHSTLEGYPRKSTPPSSSTRSTRSSTHKIRARRPAAPRSAGPTPHRGPRSAAFPSPPASQTPGRSFPRPAAGAPWRSLGRGRRPRLRRLRAWWRRPRGPSRPRWPGKGGSKREGGRGSERGRRGEREEGQRKGKERRKKRGVDPISKAAAVFFKERTRTES